jgi:hypothetical protein
MQIFAKIPATINQQAKRSSIQSYHFGSIPGAMCQDTLKRSQEVYSLVFLRIPLVAYSSLHQSSVTLGSRFARCETIVVRERGVW